MLEHFLQYHATKHGIKPIELPGPYINKLTDYSWPGNVRQLKHFAEQLLLNSNFQYCTASLDSLFNELSYIVDKKDVNIQNESPEQITENLKLSDPQSEAETIRKALLKAQFSKAKAAKILGISRTTLWRKLKELG